jgi:hypothetical protein
MTLGNRQYFLAHSQNLQMFIELSHTMTLTFTHTCCVILIFKRFDMLSQVVACCNDSRVAGYMYNNDHNFNLSRIEKSIYITT